MAVGILIAPPTKATEPTILPVSLVPPLAPQAGGTCQCGGCSNCSSSNGCGNTAVSGSILCEGCGG